MIAHRLAGCAIAAALFCLAALTAQAADTQVTIDNFTFNPPRLTVKVGTTVTWTNRDDIPHTVTAKTLAFISKALDTDDTFSFTFAQAGSYAYFCSLHPHMTGTIVVEAAGAEKPSP